MKSSHRYFLLSGMSAGLSIAPISAQSLPAAVSAGLFILTSARAVILAGFAVVAMDKEAGQ